MIKKYEKKTSHEIMHPPQKISSIDTMIKKAAELEPKTISLHQTSEDEYYQADRDPMMDLDIEEEAGNEPTHKEHIKNIKNS